MQHCSVMALRSRRRQQPLHRPRTHAHTPPPQQWLHMTQHFCCTLVFECAGIYAYPGTPQRPCRVTNCKFINLWAQPPSPAGVGIEFTTALPSSDNCEC